VDLRTDEGESAVGVAEAARFLRGDLGLGVPGKGGTGGTAGMAGMAAGLPGTPADEGAAVDGIVDSGVPAAVAVAVPVPGVSSRAVEAPRLDLRGVLPGAAAVDGTARVSTGAVSAGGVGAEDAGDSATEGGVAVDETSDAPRLALVFLVFGAAAGAAVGVEVVLPAEGWDSPGDMARALGVP